MLLQGRLHFLSASKRIQTRTTRRIFPAKEIEILGELKARLSEKTPEPIQTADNLSFVVFILCSANK